MISKKYLILVVVFYCVVFGSVLISVKLAEGKLTVTVIDVGQGDAILIKTPHGKRILIDGGSDYRADKYLAKEIFFPFCYLDVVILTHNHADHSGGLARIVNQCAIGQYRNNDVSSGENPEPEIREKFAGNSLLKTYIGDEFTIDGVLFKTLWPPRENRYDDKTLNDSSIALFIDSGSFEALFMGDLQVSAQKDSGFTQAVSSILPMINDGLDLYKVGHHGSVNATLWSVLQETKPINCVISVGEDNPFGHPSKQVVDGLIARGCNVLRTDVSGDIVIKAN
jgi:competence protein ComEC